MIYICSKSDQFIDQIKSEKVSDQFIDQIKSEKVLSNRMISYFVFNDLRWDVIVCFVDMCGIVDHHCLKCFFESPSVNSRDMCQESQWLSDLTHSKPSTLWVSEWLLFNAKWVIFQFFNCENKIHYDKMIIISILY